MAKKFYCDINGTFDNGIEREKSIKEFSSLLSKLAGEDELSFSFVSTEEPEYVLNYVNELKPYINNPNINFGKHYSCEHTITETETRKTMRGKSLQIYMDLLEKYYDEVYYADDSHLITLIVEGTLKRKFNNINLIILNTENGIDSLNTCLKGILETNKKTI